MIRSYLSLLGLALLMSFALNSSSDYLDLSTDPVVPGGLSSAQIEAYEELGYEFMVLDADGFFEDVTFKNAMGETYTRSGLVASGESCVFHEGYGETVFVTCGNKSHTMPTKETIDQEKED